MIEISGLKFRIFCIHEGEANLIQYTLTGCGYIERTILSIAMFSCVKQILQKLKRKYCKRKFNVPSNKIIPCTYTSHPHYMQKKTANDNIKKDADITNTQAKQF